VPKDMSQFESWLVNQLNKDLSAAKQRSEWFSRKKTALRQRGGYSEPLSKETPSAILAGRSLR